MAEGHRVVLSGVDFEAVEAVTISVRIYHAILFFVLGLFL